MREEEVVTRAAYLLFYQRRSAATGGDNNVGQEWLQQLLSSSSNGIPRTVTSHSLDNLLDSGMELFGVTKLRSACYFGYVTSACCCCFAETARFRGEDCIFPRHIDRLRKPFLQNRFMCGG